MGKTLIRLFPQKQSDLGLHCLGLFGRHLMFKVFEHILYVYSLDDPMGDMPTPERLVPPDMPLPMPNGGEKLDIDNKVANFLAVSYCYISFKLT